jgi:hypothetical protein
MIAMRVAALLLLVLTLVIPCAGQAAATVPYESLPGVALYSNGYLLSWNNPKFTEITFYGRDAQPIYSVKEDKRGIYPVAWAVDSDGLAAGVYERRPVWEGCIELRNSTGKLIRTIDTGTYIPQHVVFVQDHTLWTIGYIAGNDGTKGDFNVLHHYARTGQELGEGLPWSQIAGDHNSYTALQPIIGGRWMYAANDRIGFRASLYHGRGTWIEIGLSGALLGKYDLRKYGQDENGEPYYEPVAMTADGSVYAAIYKDDRFDGWATLDRTKDAWHKVTGYPKGRIIGSDGDSLVFSKGDGAWTVLQFVASGSLRVEKVQQETAALAAKP